MHRDKVMPGEQVSAGEWNGGHERKDERRRTYPVLLLHEEAALDMPRGLWR